MYPEITKNKSIAIAAARIERSPKVALNGVLKKIRSATPNTISAAMPLRQSTTASHGTRHTMPGWLP